MSEPNKISAKGVFDKVKTLAVLHAFYDAVSLYPEKHFRFNLEVEGLMDRGNIDRSMCKAHNLEAAGSSPAPCTKTPLDK